MNGRFFGTNGAHADETRHIAVRNAETGEKKVAHRRAIRNFIKGGAQVKGRSLFALLDRIIALTQRKSNPLSINRHFFATNKRALTRSDKIIRPTPARLPFPAAIAPFRAAAALKRKGTEVVYDDNAEDLNNAKREAKRARHIEMMQAKAAEFGFDYDPNAPFIDFKQIKADLAAKKQEREQNRLPNTNDPASDTSGADAASDAANADNAPDTPSADNSAGDKDTSGGVQN